MMKTVCEINTCNGCMACVAVCPKKCVSVVDSIDAYNAVIDEKKCVSCKRCEKVCPNVSVLTKNKPKNWYQGWASDDVRKNSSSGGLASAISISFINNGGYIAACVFDKGEFSFKLTNDINDISLFSGSKYVKSNPERIYNQIIKTVKNHKVLFIGLPCQVAGIRSVIGSNDNLYTIDLICHGTPSPLLLEKYLKEEGYEISRIKDIKFREKNDMGLIIDGEKIKPKRVADEYICSFLSGVNYTQNCYKCQFAQLERVSDITLGDSWGSNLKTEKKKGISLILVQTKKGYEFLDSSMCHLESVDLEASIKNNSQLSHPSPQTSKRTEFIDMIKKGKKFKSATFFTIPKMFIKQRIKMVLIKLHLLKID